MGVKARRCSGQTGRPPAAACCCRCRACLTSFCTPRQQLVFPPSLTARQRAAIHAIGEAAGLQHTSEGAGPGRRATLGSGRVEDLAGGGGGGSSSAALTDEQLIELIQQHLSIDAAPAFASQRNGDEGAQGPRAAAARGGGGGGSGSGGGGLAPNPRGMVSLEAFVQRTLPLLEMERAAEVAAAEEALSQAGV